MPDDWPDLDESDLGLPSGPVPLRAPVLAALAGMVEPLPDADRRDAEVAEGSLEAFVRGAWHTVEPSRRLVSGWVIGCVCAHLEAMTALQIKNLIICVPPGSAKSILCAVMWPAWVWTRDPGARWIFSSYGQGLSFRDSDRTRDVIQSPWYQRRWGHVYQLKRSWNTKERFATTRQGYRIATTVAGKALGERADVVVGDDLMKATEAHSQATREAVIRAWTSTLSTRATESATLRKLVIGQRLHERDLPGYLMTEVGGYETLILPMEYEPPRYFLPPGTPIPDGPAGDSLLPLLERPEPKHKIVPTVLQVRQPRWRDDPGGSGRSRPGDLLWPERFPLAAVEELKNTLVTSSAGQLQQRPAPAEGALFKADLFRHAYLDNSTPDGPSLIMGVRATETSPEPPRLPVRELRFFQTADTAQTALETAAYTAVLTFAWHRPTHQLIVWHAWRGRLDAHEQLPALIQLRQGQARWDPATRTWDVPGVLRPWPSPILLQGVEDKATGPGLCRQAKLLGHPLEPLRAPGDKVQRAADALAMLRQGRLWFLAGQNFLPDLIDEVLSFPGGAYADQVDALCWGAILAAQDELLNAEIPGDLVSWPPPPTDASGQELDPSTWHPDVETVTLAGDVEVEFDDRQASGGLGDWR